jgi:hypothetical protein
VQLELGAEKATSAGLAGQLAEACASCQRSEKQLQELQDVEKALENAKNGLDAKTLHASYADGELKDAQEELRRVNNIVTKQQAEAASMTEHCCSLQSLLEEWLSFSYTDTISPSVCILGVIHLSLSNATVQMLVPWTREGTNKKERNKNVHAGREAKEQAAGRAPGG